MPRARAGTRGSALGARPRAPRASGHARQRPRGTPESAANHRLFVGSRRLFVGGRRPPLWNQVVKSQEKMERKHSAAHAAEARPGPLSPRRRSAARLGHLQRPARRDPGHALRRQPQPPPRLLRCLLHHIERGGRAGGPRAAAAPQATAVSGSRRCGGGAAAPASDSSGGGSAMTGVGCTPERGPGTCCREHVGKSSTAAQAARAAADHAAPPTSTRGATSSKFAAAIKLVSSRAVDDGDAALGNHPPFT
ncbi:unnamed protein product [Prorocentrum cordatum]|uniref:Uncharacterized protein n=1 Tax=Prorocentrum cordatum TaxID=2364126 RepID=A0ABN9Q680_9DINO|nr:unnamed protein product [Polarella glacialis]